MRARGTVWSPQEIELARDLFKRRATEAEFMALLGCEKKTAQNRIYRTPLGSHHYVMVEKISIPEDVIEDRNRRLMARKSLTAQLMGDPPPGRSALEQRS